MGLAKYKQDETARHRLWLTIALENIPQIVISLLYATELAGFDNTVLAALLSSILSVILATLSVFLEFPKDYFIYQVGIKLNPSQNPKLRRSLRMRRTMSNVICEALDRDFGFLFVENVHFNGIDFVCFNVVSNEAMKELDHVNSKRRHCITLDSKQRRKMMNALFENKVLKIKSQQLAFTFIDHKRVRLSLCCCCKSSNGTNGTSMGNRNMRINSLEERMGVEMAGMAPHDLRLGSATFSNSTFSNSGTVTPAHAENEEITIIGDTTSDILFGEKGMDSKRPTSRRTINLGDNLEDDTDVDADDNGISTRGKLSGNTNIAIDNDLGSELGLCVYKDEWQSWTSTQLSIWIETKLRQSATELRNKRDNANDDEIEIEIETFMTKFDEQQLNGPLLLLMKQNDASMKDFASIMKHYGFGLFLIARKAIDSLKMYDNDNNSNSINSGRNEEQDEKDQHVDPNVDTATVTLLAAK